MATYVSTYDPASAPTDLEFVEYEKRDHVVYIRINRPEVRNALHTYTYLELRRIWRDMQNDPNIYVGILTGNGKAFSAGRDIKFLSEFQAEGKRTPHEDPNSPTFHWGGGGMPEDSGLEKPLICALNGFAVGVGLTLALQCHLRVMADDAWIGDQHTNVGRLGSPHKKYIELPRATAAYLTLCNGRLSAQECLTQGIVNRVAPQDKIIEVAEELADMVCQSSPMAVQAAVKLYRLTAATQATKAINDYAHALDKEIAESDDGAEGPRAFKEKRRPVWSQR
jgi:enoyl-CoA hydratase/carnithine racemase